MIDFGGLAVGDPAVDMMAAWTVFEPEARGAFHVALDVDNDTWARGRGWSVSWGMDALAYYGTTNPVLAGIAKFTIGQALLDR